VTRSPKWPTIITNQSHGTLPRSSPSNSILPKTTPLLSRNWPSAMVCRSTDLPRCWLVVSMLFGLQHSEALCPSATDSWACGRLADRCIPLGLNPDTPTYVAIKGKVFDVSGNKSYGPEGPYKGMCGHWSWKSPLEGTFRFRALADRLMAQCSGARMRREHWQRLP